MTSPLDAITARTTELDLDACRPRIGAIYFLIDGDEIVYIGQTMQLIQRIGLHIGGDRRNYIERFDRVRFFTCDADDLDRYEGALIRALRPRHTRRAPVWRGQDNKTLRELGLPELDDEAANADDWHRSVYAPRGPLSKHDLKFRKRMRTKTQRATQAARARRLFAGIEAAYLSQRTASDVVLADHETKVEPANSSVRVSVHSDCASEVVEPETQRNAAKGAA